jgi:capsule polysaccharide modification protein KpsS
MKHTLESYCYDIEKEKSQNGNTFWKIRKDNMTQRKDGFGDRRGYIHGVRVTVLIREELRLI